MAEERGIWQRHYWERLILNENDLQSSDCGERATPNARNHHAPMKYWRVQTAGGTCFFTVNLADRLRTLFVDHVAALRTSGTHRDATPSLRDSRVGHTAHHLHAIWTMSEDGGDFATCWMLIKVSFSRCIPVGERGI